MAIKRDHEKPAPDHSRSLLLRRRRCRNDGRPKRSAVWSVSKRIAGFGDLREFLGPRYVRPLFSSRHQAKRRWKLQRCRTVQKRNVCDECGCQSWWLRRRSNQSAPYFRRHSRQDARPVLDRRAERNVQSQREPTSDCDDRPIHCSGLWSDCDLYDSFVFVELQRGNARRLEKRLNRQRRKQRRYSLGRLDLEVIEPVRDLFAAIRFGFLCVRDRLEGVSSFRNARF